MPATITDEVYCEPHHWRHFGTTGLSWCTGCHAWHHSDYGCPVSGQPCEDEPPPFCEDCQDSHTSRENCQRAWCDDCDDWHERDSWGDITCPGWWCDDCGDWHEYGEDCPTPYCSDCREFHAPDAHSNCYCEAPRQSFTVPNDGQSPLANGERATVHLAAGVISDEGVREITRYLRAIGAQSDLSSDAGKDEYYAWCNLSYGLDEIGAQWQTRQGNFTKRLSRHAYQNHNLKIPSEVLSHVGNIAREHSTAADLMVEVTRDLNRPAEDFYHEDSCWWGSYSESRCALKSNGGFGLRSFSENGCVTGRAWVMPLRRDGDSFAPTFDTVTPDALVVFNGYGDLSGYAAARVIAAMYGWTYAKRGEFDCEPMYVNAGGYLVGPEDIVSATKRLALNVDQHASIHEKELVNVA